MPWNPLGQKHKGRCILARHSALGPHTFREQALLHVLLVKSQYSAFAQSSLTRHSSLKMASKSGISKSDGEFELAMKLLEGEAECKVTSFPSSPRVMKLGLVGNTRALSVVAGLLLVVVVIDDYIDEA